MRFAGRRPFITAPAWATRVERGHAYWSRLSLRRRRGLRHRNYRARVDDRVGEQQVTVQTNVARNFPRSFFETARKRWNSNVLNSMFEILAGELRAKLLGNHSGNPRRSGHRRGGGGVGGMAAAPVGGGAWPGFETTRRAPAAPQAPLVWRAPEGPEGTAGLRADAPSRRLAARTASGRAAAHRHTQRPSPKAGPDGARNNSGATSNTAQGRGPAGPRP